VYPPSAQECRGGGGIFILFYFIYIQILILLRAVRSCAALDVWMILLLMWSRWVVWFSYKIPWEGPKGVSELLGIEFRFGVARGGEKAAAAVESAGSPVLRSCPELGYPGPWGAGMSCKPAGLQSLSPHRHRPSLFFSPSIGFSTPSVCAQSR
jgi:hypothetical protein